MEETPNGCDTAVSKICALHDAKLTLKCKKIRLIKLSNQHTRELISIKDVTQNPTKRPELPTVTLTWHANCLQIIILCRNRRNRTIYFCQFVYYIYI